MHGTNLAAAQITAPRPRRAARSSRVRVAPATAVFAGATAVGALHMIDAALVERWHGESARRGAPAAILAVLLAVAASLAWPRLPRGPRALLAFVGGLLLLVVGGLSILTLLAGDTEGGAVSGVLAVPAGAALLACAALSLRGAPQRSRAARWGRRALGAMVVVLSLMWIVMPVGAALFVSGKPRAAVPAGALGVPHLDVRFASTDGLRLAGWYVPSRNGAAVLLVHGGGGSRLGAVLHARMLARAGYGVLLYDERGRGESQGAPDAIGWTWSRDVAGAIRWLGTRPDVHPGKIGALGLSTGAEAALQAAAQRDDVHAVVADGAEARNVAEASRAAGATDMPYWAALYLANRVLSATAPAPDLGRLVEHLRAPALLVAAGRGQEAEFGRIYARRSRGRAQLWEVPDAGHTRTLATHPAAYRARVIRFFDRTLRPNAP